METQTYEIKTECMNCGHVETMNIPLGTPIYKCTCNKCKCEDVLKKSIRNNMLTILIIIALIYFVPKEIVKAIRDNDQRIHDEFTKLDNNK